MPGQWNDKVFGVKEEGFEALALELFRFQSENNPVYANYLQALKINPQQVQSIEQIPFLPVRFFNRVEENGLLSGTDHSALIFLNGGIMYLSF